MRDLQTGGDWQGGKERSPANPREQHVSEKVSVQGLFDLEVTNEDDQSAKPVRLLRPISPGADLGGTSNSCQERGQKKMRGTWQHIYTAYCRQS